MTRAIGTVWVLLTLAAFWGAALLVDNLLNR